MDCLLFKVSLALAWLLKLGEEACVSMTLDLFWRPLPFFTLEDAVREFLLELSAVVRRETEGESPMTDGCLLTEGDLDTAACGLITDGDLTPLLVDWRVNDEVLDDEEDGEEPEVNEP